MIDTSALERIAGWIDSRGGRATILCGGNVNGRCLDATVIEERRAEFELCAKEAFGADRHAASLRDFDEHSHS